MMIETKQGGKHILANVIQMEKLKELGDHNKRLSLRNPVLCTTMQANQEMKSTMLP